MLRLGKKVILGCVEDGEWAEGTMQIVIDETNKSIGVYHLQKARPNAKMEQLGTLYARDGTSVSGVFNDEILK